MRNSLVRPRFNTSPTRLVATNIEYWARRLACPRARNVHRRFQTKPLVTARQKEMVALIHHGVLGVIWLSSSQRVPLSMTVLLAPTRQNLTSWRVPVRRRSAVAWVAMRIDRTCLSQSDPRLRLGSRDRTPRLPPGGEGERRAAAGGAGAADLPEPGGD